MSGINIAITWDKGELAALATDVVRDAVKEANLDMVPLADHEAAIAAGNEAYEAVTRRLEVVEAERDALLGGALTPLGMKMLALLRIARLGRVGDRDPVCALCGARPARDPVDGGAHPSCNPGCVLTSVIAQADALPVVPR